MFPAVVICALTGSALLSVATNFYEQDRRGRAPSMATAATLHIVGFTLFAAACFTVTPNLSLPVLALMIFAATMPFLGYVPVSKRRRAAPAE